MPITPRFDRRWIHSRQHPLFVLLVDGERTSKALELLPDSVPVHKHCWGIPCAWSSQASESQWLGWLEMALCH